MTVPIYSVLVRRDAHTTTPVTIPVYEVPILQIIFGEENIQNAIGRPLVGDVQLTEADAVGTYEPPNDEFERLARKYGGDEGGLYVEQAHGKKAAKGLAAAIEKAGKPQARRGPKPKDTETKEGGEE
jgi:hypothetical protein